MINVSHALEHFDIDTKSVPRAVEGVRIFIGDDVRKASKLLKDIIGVDVKFDDTARACKTLQSLIGDIVKHNCQFDDGVMLLNDAKAYADVFVSNPHNTWMFAEKEPDITASKEIETTAVVEGIETKVAIHASGKIKKGGKQILADALYKKYVIEASTPMEVKTFKKLLVKEVQLTTSGANTYYNNLKKKHITN